MEQDTPVVNEAPPASVRAFAGHCDGLSGTMIHGWAVEGGQPCEVRLVVNGAELLVRSERPRADLAQQGLSQGLGGWGIDIGRRLRDGENRIEAYFPNGRPITGSPIVTQIALADLDLPPIQYRGAIDYGDTPVLIGWSVDPEGTGAPVTVEVEGHAPFAILTTYPRDDLVASGISNGGGASWLIDVTHLLKPGSNTIHFRFPDGTPLPGSPRQLYVPIADESAPPTPPVAAAPAPVVAEPAHAPEPIEAPAPADRPLTLTELDEVSLDDLIDAVAAGMIDVALPLPPPEIEEEAPLQEAQAPQRTARPGFFGRLFGKR